ncbi:MAG: DUF4405 domain-containing protein [Candidatus Marinarcus sp.]|uniref:DUF4405 domain-containing protein n=1 Tax=Candidatus Marinarcus sp. TaxID=3100987 RepID=UPI003B006071
MATIQWKSVATSFTATTFFVIGTTGVMLYLHFFDKNVKELHEILGLVFVAVTLFHIFYNWKSMKNYFSKKVFLLSVLLIGSISSIFIFNSLGQKENPKVLIINSVLNAPLQDALTLLNLNYETAKVKLATQSINIDNAHSILELAKSNSMSPFKIIGILNAKD